MKLEACRDELEHAGLILADARLVFAATRANLLGLGHIVLDTHLGQAIVIRLARAAELCRRHGLTNWFGKRSGNHVGLAELEQMPLSRVLHQPLPPRTEDIAAVKLDLVPQFLDLLLEFLDGLIMKLRRLIKGGALILKSGALVCKSGLLVCEGCLEIRNLVSELAQQVVACVGISGPLL